MINIYTIHFNNRNFPREILMPTVYPNKSISKLDSIMLLNQTLIVKFVSQCVLYKYMIKCSTLFSVFLTHWQCKVFFLTSVKLLGFN